MTSPAPFRDDATDLIDRLAGIENGSPMQGLRHQRDKVRAATQGSYEALFDPALDGLSVPERLLVALFACRLTPAPELAAHYHERAVAACADAQAIAAVATGEPGEITEPRLHAMLSFTRSLVEHPVDGDRAALQALLAAGITTAAAIALAQLVAFVSYQTRLVAGLGAIQMEGHVG
ncbi:CMD domain protein [Polaromonas sp. C04]|uniref:CMD domain protein n=1 Tax=Polaromonas sp. C04 TaxID=1945857 RepID=UPI000985A414|nr:CMD domain protein [Polaromonas sp. C04]OOG57548.1 CMD domain protein [Polaromonas sp. C04]